MQLLEPCDSLLLGFDYSYQSLARLRLKLFVVHRFLRVAALCLATGCAGSLRGRTALSALVCRLCFDVLRLLKEKFQIIMFLRMLTLGQRNTQILVVGLLGLLDTVLEPRYLLTERLLCVCLYVLRHHRYFIWNVRVHLEASVLTSSIISFFARIFRSVYTYFRLALLFCLKPLALERLVSHVAEELGRYALVLFQSFNNDLSFFLHLVDRLLLLFVLLLEALYFF